MGSTLPARMASSTLPASVPTSSWIKTLDGTLTALPDGTPVLRCRIAGSEVHKMKVGAYQRERLPAKKLGHLISEWVAGGFVPGAVGAVRSTEFEAIDGGGFLIKADLWLVDGQQRRASLEEYLKLPNAESRDFFIEIILGTTEEYERKLFHKLNSHRKKVSSNVLLRNQTHTYSALRLIMSVCTTKSSSILFDKIAWKDTIAPPQLLGAFSLTKVIIPLYSWTGLADCWHLGKVEPALEEILGIVGSKAMTANIEEFFGFVDKAWGWSAIQKANTSTHRHLKLAFLWVLARLFAEYQNFWNGNLLVIPADIRKALASIPMTAKTIKVGKVGEMIELAGAYGNAQNQLKNKLEDYLKRNGVRLVPRE